MKTEFIYTQKPFTTYVDAFNKEHIEQHDNEEVAFQHYRYLLQNHYNARYVAGRGYYKQVSK